MSEGSFGLCCCVPSGCSFCAANLKAGDVVAAGAVFVGAWSPGTFGYEQHSFTPNADRYLIAYCGGAVGMTEQNFDIPGVSPNWQVSKWATTVFIADRNTLPHQWQDPQWVLPYNLMALAYGAGGFHIDPGFPQPDGNSNVGIISELPTVSTTPAFPQPPVVFSPNPIYTAAGDTKAALASAARLTNVLPIFGSCHAYRFNSDGSSPVQMQFTAPFYANFQPFSEFDPAGTGIFMGRFRIRLPPGGTAPKFALVRLVAMFTATTSCAFINGPNQYTINLFFRNESDFPWSGTCSLALPGGIVINGNGNGWGTFPHQTTHASFDISTGAKEVVAVLTLTDTFGLVEKLNFDMTPMLLNVTAQSNGADIFGDINKNIIQISWQDHNGFPFNPIQVKVDLSGGVTGVFDVENNPLPGNIVPGSPVSTQCSNPPGGEFVFSVSTSTVKPDSITLSFSVLDNGAASAMPPFVLVVPLKWT